MTSSLHLGVEVITVPPVNVHDGSHVISLRSTLGHVTREWCDISPGEIDCHGIKILLEKSLQFGLRVFLVQLKQFVLVRQDEYGSPFRDDVRDVLKFVFEATGDESILEVVHFDRVELSDINIST